MPFNSRQAVNVYDYRELARKKLPKKFFDYLDGGSYNEMTIHENKTAYQSIHLHKRIFQDVSHSDTTTQIFDQKITQPVILAPVGYAGIYARRGEVQAAHAAERAGVPFCLSTLAIASIEEIHHATKQPFWFQLYMMDDRDYCLDLFQRAQLAGCSVLVFTVDLPVLGIRYRDLRNGMFNINGKKIPISTKLNQAWEYLSHYHWFYDVLLRGRPLTLGNLIKFNDDFRTFGKYRITLSWKDLEWVRNNWPGKIIVKGVLDNRDANKAASLGIDGIVVSNHAGRHLDATQATISALPKIAKEVGDKLTILVDGGIFSGLDIFKAIASGAHACMIGRAWAYALAANGEQGVTDVLTMLRLELEHVMAHLGVANINQIDRSFIEP